jgi:hypothetical protein
MVWVKNRFAHFDFRDGFEERVGLLRDDGISEGSKAVHPRGNPMSHSTHVGFNAPVASRAIAVARSSPPLAGRFIRAKSGPLGEPFGVGQSFTAVCSPHVECFSSRRFPASKPSGWASLASGVGQVFT